MTMNKILVSIYVPALDEKYDFWIPINKKVYKVILLLIRLIYEKSDGHYEPTTLPLLYDKLTAKYYDIDLTVKENKIMNGTQMILI